MSVADLKYETTFKISTTALRSNRSHTDIKRDIFWFIQFLLLNAILFFITINLIFSIIHSDIPNGEYAEASKNGIMTIVGCTVTFKYIVLLYHQAAIKNIINDIDKDYETAREFPKEEQDIVLRYAMKGVVVCKFWLVTGLSNSSVYYIKAVLCMIILYHKGEFKLVPPFDMEYPDAVNSKKNELGMFIFLFLMSFLFSVYSMSMFVGFDPIPPICMLHCCGQIEILCGRISKIFHEAEDSKEIAKKFKAINAKLQNIYRFIEDLENFSTTLYEYNMKITTLAMPLAAFQVSQSLRLREFNLEFTAFFFGCILHAFVPCLYSDLVMEKSEELRQAIYSSGWEGHTTARKTVLMMLTRTSRPLVVSSIFYPICLDTFAEMCRQAYAIFNIMNASCT